MLLRVHPDFNSMNADPEERVSLPTHHDPGLIKHLRPGVRIILYEPFDLDVEAVVEYDAGHWYGRPDWSTQRNLQSRELKEFWEVADRLRALRGTADAAQECRALEERAVLLWKSLADDERDYLRDVPQFREYNRFY